MCRIKADFNTETSDLKSALLFDFFQNLLRNPDIYPEELMPEIRAAFEADIVDEILIDLANIEGILADGREATLRN